jgi:uncharacterized protein involved in response to NO
VIESTAMVRAPSVLWGRGFRSFFLLAAAEAIVAISIWIAGLRGLAPVPAWATPVAWHAHEMSFGFAGAAIAGFLLTSVPVWTNRPAASGMRLAGFAALWLAGRIAVFCSNALPSVWIAAVVDASFFVALALAIAPSIYVARSRRNYAFPVLLLVLAAANLLAHFEALGIGAGFGPAGRRLAVGVVIVLISTLGGRLVPLFTGAALKRAGSERGVSHTPWADVAAAPLLVGFVALDTVWPDAIATGILAWATACTLALRARGWGLRASLGDPLLWSMHVAYLWVPVGLALLGAAVFSDAVPRNIATHALTTGAIGGMILAIMSRVALGHTGRPFRAPPGMAAAYGLVFAAALARTGLPLLLPDWTPTLLLVSGGLWIAAFAIFLYIYTPFLITPRIDGKPG